MNTAFANAVVFDMNCDKFDPLEFLLKFKISVIFRRKSIVQIRNILPAFKFVAEK